MSTPRAARPDPILPARERAVRLVAAAIEDGRVRLRRWGAQVMASFGGGEEISVTARGSSAHRAVRRQLRNLYAGAHETQPSDEALRAMVDALVSAAERLPPPVTSGSRDGEADASGPAVASDVLFEREGGGRESQGDLLLQLAEAEGVELWHTPGQDLYASVRVNGRSEHWPLESRDLKRWLRRKFYEIHEKAPRSESVKDALGVLEGRAMVGPEHEISTRIAGHEGCIYVDLADKERQIVAITPQGWRIATDVPVRFRRPAGMLPMPPPVRGGSIEELRSLINLPNEDAWTLLVGFLLCALHPNGPYLVLVLIGEKGTAKSTATRLIVLLLDPKDAPLRRPPREERDLAIAARHGRVIAFNNVSTLSAGLSDAISVLATEGGFATRTLFTDDEETRFRDRRPIVLNGIPDVVTRGDLADRSMKVVLAPIARGKRREEAALLAEFEGNRPRILGALYDAVAHGLATVDDVVLQDFPRMADAAKWVTAAEPALGWRPGTFVAAHERAMGEAAAAVVEADRVALAIRDLAATRSWRGTAGELLKLLTERTPDAHKLKDWPASPQGMASAIRRCAPELRKVGVEVVQDERDDAVLRTRLWSITLVQLDEGPCPGCGVLASDAHECAGDQT